MAAAITAIGDVLFPGCVAAHVREKSKKRVLECSAGMIAGCHPSAPDAADIFCALLAREKLGSTAAGKGVALPHCRLKSCVEPVAAFIQLEEAVEFDAPDRKAVDLVFILVIPDSEAERSVELLRMISARLADPQLCSALRAVPDSRSLHRLLSECE